MSLDRINNMFLDNSYGTIKISHCFVYTIVTCQLVVALSSTYNPQTGNTQLNQALSAAINDCWQNGTIAFVYGQWFAVPFIYQPTCSNSIYPDNIVAEGTFKKVLDTRILTIASQLTQPYLFYNISSGQLTGDEFEIANAIVLRLNQHYQTQIQINWTFPNITTNYFLNITEPLQNEEADVVMSDMSALDSRKAFVEFTCSYAPATGTTILRSGLDPEWKPKVPADFNFPNVTIAVLSGSTYQTYFEKFTPNAIKVSVSSVDEAFKCVLNQTVHAAISEDTPLDYFIVQHPNCSCYTLYTFRFDVVLGPQDFIVMATRNDTLLLSSSHDKQLPLTIIISVSVVAFVICHVVLFGMILYGFRRRIFHSHPDVELPQLHKHGVFVETFIQQSHSSGFDINTSKFVEPESFPLLVSKWNLDFKREDNQDTEQFPINRVVTDSIVLTNPGPKSMKFSIFPPPQDHKVKVTFSPSHGKVGSDKNVLVKVELEFFCTTKISLQIPIALASNKKQEPIIYDTHSVLKYTGESVLSTKLNYEEFLASGSPIGEGSFGIVYCGEWRGQQVAIKTLKVQDLTQDVLMELRREIDISSKLRHPNVVEFIGASTVPGKIAIVTAFVPLGSLAKYLNKDFHMKTKLKYKIALDTAKGMTFLPDNLLVVSLSSNSVVNIKLSDFGTARTVTDQTKNFTKMIGTPSYMAPEVLKSETYTSAADVYSYGIILYEIWVQDVIYKEFRHHWDLTNFVVQGKHLPIPENCPEDYSELIKRCWNFFPEERPKMSVMVEKLETYWTSKYGSTQPRLRSSSTPPNGKKLKLTNSTELLGTIASKMSSTDQISGGKDQASSTNISLAIESSNILMQSGS